jgi:hypothetical protein
MFTSATACQYIIPGLPGKSRAAAAIRSQRALVVLVFQCPIASAHEIVRALEPRQSPQLFQRFGAVVDPKVEDAVGDVPGRLCRDDDRSRRLLPADVSPGCLRRIKGVKQALGQVAFDARQGERRRWPDLLVQHGVGLR